MLRRGIGLITPPLIARHSLRTMSTPAAVPDLEPPSKSSIKKAEKLAAAAARKSLKEVISAANGVAAVVTGAGKKKEKPVVAVVEELPFIEVPYGHKKGQFGLCSASRVACSVVECRRGQEKGLGRCRDSR